MTKGWFDEYFMYFKDNYYMEKQLRKLDGKKRLIRNPRKGLIEKLMIPKWIVDTDDEVYRSFKDKVCWNLFQRFEQDNLINDYVDRYGVVNARHVIQTWFEVNFKPVVRQTLRKM